MMRIVFAGTTRFAATALSALSGARHDIVLVLTQPDRPAGRGRKEQASAVKRTALASGLPLKQPLSLKDPELVQTLRALAPEALVVAAYGLLVPPQILDLPPRGCLNIHASLLPRWRGAAPIQRALLAGDRCTGVSIMRMDAGLDTGPVLLTEATPIGPDDTAGTLEERLAEMGARLILRALSEPATLRPQDPAQATYAPKLTKREALIDWSVPASVLDRQVRALNPTPGATTTLAGNPVKVWRARPTGAAGELPPGTVVRTGRDAIAVACGDETALDVLELQRAGAKRLSAAAFLAGQPLPRGTRFGDG
jgi:methionyl-tRNA formyltransferase